MSLDGVRYRSMVRAMGRQIDPSWWTHSAISRSSQCPMIGVTKAMLCVILSVAPCI